EPGLGADPVPPSDSPRSDSMVHDPSSVEQRSPAATVVTDWLVEWPKSARRSRTDSSRSIALAIVFISLNSVLDKTLRHSFGRSTEIIAEPDGPVKGVAKTASDCCYSKAAIIAAAVAAPLVSTSRITGERSIS